VTLSDLATVEPPRSGGRSHFDNLSPTLPITISRIDKTDLRTVMEVGTCALPANAPIEPGVTSLCVRFSYQKYFLGP